MKLIFLSTFLVLLGLQFERISANTDPKTNRQTANYEFPGLRKAQYEELIERYDPSARVAAAQTYSPSVADPDDYSGQYNSQPSRGSASRTRTPQSRKDQEDEEARRAAEEEEEKKPDRLALLLQDSKFTCGDKKDGYYADETVACQVFHYCVAGAKHSWQCPENTVFHQIHLNCVPSAQDICTQSSKFHVVNDYLYKELEQRGPNNSIRYHQRFYPEGFDFGGDVLSQVLPQSQPQRPASQYNNNNNNYRESDDYESRGNSRSQADNYPSYQSYPAPAPAPVRSQPPPRPAPRPIYKPQPVRTTTTQAYNPPTYTTAAQPKPTSRPYSYSTPSQYSPSSYADSDDSDSYDSYPSSNTNTGYSSNTGYNSPASSYSAPSTYSAPSSSYSAPTSSYPSSSYSGSLSSSNYPSSGSSSSSSLGSSSALSSYRPVQAVKPASYPSRGIGIPIASFRVSNSPSYGSSGSASNLRAAHPSQSTFSLGAFNSEMASGVKYDEDY